MCISTCFARCMHLPLVAMKEKNHMLYIPYYKTLKFIKWLKVNRAEKDYSTKSSIESINTAIIIHSCIVIESFLTSILKDELFISNHKLNEKREIEKIKNPRIIENLFLRINQDLEKASWSSYAELFELIIDYKFDKDSVLWKSMNFMFQYRNMLVHGSEIVIQKTQETAKCPFSSPNSKLTIVLKYFFEVGLISGSEDLKSISILTNEIADHFFNNMRLFVLELMDQLKEMDKKFSRIDMFEFKYEYH